MRDTMFENDPYNHALALHAASRSRYVEPELQYAMASRASNVCATFERDVAGWEHDLVSLASDAVASRSPALLDTLAGVVALVTHWKAVGVTLRASIDARLATLRGHAAVAAEAERAVG